MSLVFPAEGIVTLSVRETEARKTQLPESGRRKKRESYSPTSFSSAHAAVSILAPGLCRHTGLASNRAPVEGHPGVRDLGVLRTQGARRKQLNGPKKVSNTFSSIVQRDLGPHSFRVAAWCGLSGPACSRNTQPVRPRSGSGGRCRREAGLAGPGAPVVPIFTITKSRLR